MIIAVDGPTASGKGTIAKALAVRFALPHLDTGLLYRAVGRQVALRGGDPDSEADALAACDFADDLLADPELRSEVSGGLASRVSIHPAVRQTLFQRQRAFAAQPGGAVLDGRDTGTVIAPDADVKLFVTASISARAQRRYAEMRDRGHDVTLESVTADLSVRDARDSTRKDAPLIPATDAITLDTSDLSRGEAVAAAIAIVQERLAGCQGSGHAE
jgi:cytidylate kinase